MSALGIPRHIATLDPRNIEHVLKSKISIIFDEIKKKQTKHFEIDNFENYIKGPEFHASLVSLFGNGIFNANGEDWKYQRKTASHIFNVKNFRDHFTE